MEQVKLEFDRIRKSKDPEVLNDFIIDLSKNPKVEYLEYLKYLIENSNPQIFDKIKLNLIFTLGEIGSISIIDEYYLTFIYEIYHLSDRWIRNEIIQTIGKISRTSKLPENIVLLIGNALNDDYNPIKINALQVLYTIESFPDRVFTNLFNALNSKDPEVLEGCRRVFNRIYLRVDNLFNKLDLSNNYKILKSSGIRSLLLAQFKSIINLFTC